MADLYTGEQVFFQEILRIFVWLVKKAYGRDIFQKGEVKLMANFIVKDNNPDVGVKITIGDVTDAEGHPADASSLKTEITSSDDSVVSVTDNGDGSGNVSFGAPGQASTQYQVKDAAGNVIGSGSDGFTVTAGDPAAISGVTATFDGLTPVDETPAP